MAKGIIYVMSTPIDGLIKIGKTTDFDKRMWELERNGYYNMNGLHKAFAIEVENFDEKEKFIHSLFEKSQVKKSELFAVDLDQAISLLSSLEGTIIYPKDNSKEEIFVEAAERFESNVIPDGEYTYVSTSKLHKFKGVLESINGVLCLKKGSILSPLGKSVTESIKEFRAKLKIKGCVLLEDCNNISPSLAASIVAGGNRNGWTCWKNSKKQFIDIYRNIENND